MAPAQAKADPTLFDYKTMRPLGKIQDMVLSDENKMFALKTAGAKIGDTEYPIWVGNSDNLASAFSSSWTTNAAPSCAFFKNKLYIAPKTETNYLYRADVGNGQLPKIGSAERLNLSNSDGSPVRMQAPYLYATDKNLYAIENAQNGPNVHILAENGNGLRVTKSLALENYNGVSFQKEQIKDIVSTRAGDQDFLYILTTNGQENANLWLVRGNRGEYSAWEPTFLYITPPQWKNDTYYTPLFDHTTSIAVHCGRLLTANANYKHQGDSLRQMGRAFSLSSEGEPNYPGNNSFDETTYYRQSDTFRTSAIGSDQSKYYAEAIDSQDNSMDPNLNKYFIQGQLEYKNFYEDGTYYDYSTPRTGEPVYKFTTRKEGEIFAISPSSIYRIKDSDRSSSGF